MSVEWQDQVARSVRGRGERRVDVPGTRRGREGQPAEEIGRHRIRIEGHRPVEVRRRWIGVPGEGALEVRVAEVSAAVHGGHLDSVSGVTEGPCLRDVVAFSRRDQVRGRSAVADRINGRRVRLHAVRRNGEHRRRDAVDMVERRDLLEQPGGHVHRDDPHAASGGGDRPDGRWHAVLPQEGAERVDVVRQDRDAEGPGPQSLRLLDRWSELIPCRRRFAGAIEQSLHRRIHRWICRRGSAQGRRTGRHRRTCIRGRFREAGDRDQQDRGNHEDGQRDGPRTSNKRIHERSSCRATVKQLPREGPSPNRSPNSAAHREDAI